MGIEHRWQEIPNHTQIKMIVFDYIGQWTWSEFHSLHLDIIAEMEKQEIKLYPIINIGSNTYLPPAALSHLTKDALINHPDVIRVSMVINNFFIRTIASLVTKIVKNNVTFFSHLEEAEKAILEDVKARQATQ